MKNILRTAKLPQIESVRLYRQIARLLSVRINQGLFPIGSFLPPERELSEQLGVSRTSVREALIALEVAGQIEIRPGHGVQVLRSIAPLPQALAQPPTDIGPIQIMEAREIVEVRCAALAATNHTLENLAAMEQAIARQAAAKLVSSPEYSASDRAFHVEIARASANPAFELLVSSLWEYRTKPLFRKFESLLMGPERPRKTIDEHRKIHVAIAAGDPVAAERAMKQHLTAVLRAFLKGQSRD